MKQLKVALMLTVLLLMGACASGKWQVVARKSTRIAIDSTTNAMADSSYVRYLQPQKKQIDSKMDSVIGYVAETMKASGPESLLSNFSADVYRKAASDYLKQPVDMSIVNLGGLRTQIPAGPITVRKVFELMPFENELVVLWLRGDKLMELLQFFASVGGEGQSGVRMGIRNGKAINVTIGGTPLDAQKLYSIATNDYLAGGNDKMLQLAESEKKVSTGIKVRNMLMNYIKNETRSGRKIQSSLDGRITIVNQ